MRIHRLRVSVKHLGKQMEFYGNTLGMTIKVQPGGFEVLAGETLLQFTTEVPFSNPYHIAFNIPFDKVPDGFDWLNERTPILKGPNGLSIQEFSSWKARAFYFYDADGNILEFIGRERIPAPEKPFGPDSILSVSEIGLPADDPQSLFKVGFEDIGMQQFDCGNFEFCALGNDEGLFIMVRNRDKHWFPTDEIASEVWFDTTFEHERKKYYLEVEGGHAKLLLPLPMEMV